MYIYIYIYIYIFIVSVAPRRQAVRLGRVDRDAVAVPDLRELLVFFLLLASLV